MDEQNQQTNGQQNPPPQPPPSPAPEASSTNKNVGMAVVAYVIFFLPLLTDAKNDTFVRYHVRQGLVLFIAAVIVSIIGAIPVFGLLTFPLSIILLILFVIGVVNALEGKEKPLPVIGEWAEKLKV